MPAPALRPGATVEVFYDGDCPLCMKEIRMLMRKDRRAHIQFTDIAAAGFEPITYGRTMEEFMARIRGRLPDASWIEGVEVFRRLYTAIGFGWLVAVTRVPPLSLLLHLGYRVFAANRLRLTGRCAPDGSCELPHASGSPTPATRA